MILAMIDARTGLQFQGSEATALEVFWSMVIKNTRSWVFVFHIKVVNSRMRFAKHESPVSSNYEEPGSEVFTDSSKSGRRYADLGQHHVTQLHQSQEKTAK
jgi:hypothetical protein